MNKKAIGLLILIIMSIDIYADALSDLFPKGRYDGNVRLGYQSHEVSNDREDEVATGVELHFETAAYYGVQAGATLFTSYGDGEEGFEGIQFFDEENDNYAILGEAYLKGTFSNTVITLGRQTFDTPFADSDDIGMVRNTFEAFTIVNKGIEDTTLSIAQVQKWSGVDSPDPGSFTEVNGDTGMQIVGITYEGIDKTTLAGWFYNISDEVKISYLEASYEDETESLEYGGIIQYALQDYDSGGSSTIYGAAASLGVKQTGLTATVSYNKTNGIAADNFFGGGPFVTNVEHNTLKEAGPDGRVILYTLEWDASVAGLEGVNFTINVDAHQEDTHEYDLGMQYDYSPTVNFSAIYSDVKSTEKAFQNFRMFANYSF